MPKSNLKSAEKISALPSGVTLTALENGLTIIIREDRSAPVVSAQAWAMTGSIHEGERIGAGLSHVLEHMLFKGTTTRPGSRIDQEVQEAGGYMNAYTSFDRTVYHIDLPSSGTRTAIDILCDIMQNAALPEDELAKELDVIRREMDMNQDDPGRRAGRRLFETAYTRSPYRYTVIGYPDVFNELKPENIRAYYREKYVPNNVFYVVVGDVQNAAVVEQIKSAYAKSKSKPLPPSVLPAEPRQAAPRDIIEDAPVELGHFHFAWHIPDIRHHDIPALDVLGVLLGAGRSSRLFVEVREKLGLVNHADAWTYNPGNPGLFGMSAVVDADKFERARDAMLAEIEKLKRKPVAKAELGKAVKQYISATFATRKTMQGQAQDLGGSWLAAGDLNFSERFLAAVKQLKPSDLQRVARHYLTRENRSLYALLPAGSAPKTVVAEARSTENAIQKFTLPNGLRLLVKEDHRLPFVEFRGVFQGGVLAETQSNNGVTQLLAKMLLQGTRKRSAQKIAGDIESVGGSVDTYGGNNSFGVNLEVLSSDFAAGLDVFADVILNPSFPAAALEREKQIQISGIRARKDDMLKSGSIAMRRALYGETGYGLDSLGSEASVSSIKVADLRTMHGGLVTPANCVIAIYGDVKAASVKSAVTRAFVKWKSSGGPNNFKPGMPESRLSGIRRVTETREKKQAVIVLGFGASTLQAEDRYALELLSEACSDLGSRLFLRVREKLGLAYYVGAQNFPGIVPGHFSFYAGTEPEKVAQVEEEFLAEVALLRNEGLTQSELDRAKAKIIGQKKIARQDLGGYAMTTALDELYGLGFAQTDSEDEKFQAVTLDAVKSAAQKYLTPDSLVISVVKPA
jgi:zinc protease